MSQSPSCDRGYKHRLNTGKFVPAGKRSCELNVGEGPGNALLVRQSSSYDGSDKHRLKTG